MNIGISIILVFNYGLIGVAVGTLVSMLFRTIQYIWYYHVKLLKESSGLVHEAARIGISALEVGIIILFSHLIPEASSNSYVSWLVNSCLIGIGCLVIVSIVSVIFYRTECNDLLCFAKRLLRRSS